MSNYIHRNEKFSGRNYSLAERLDEVCADVQERAIFNVSDLRKILSTIERGADALGCSLRLHLLNDFSSNSVEYSVRDFCKRCSEYLPSSDDTHLEVFWSGGEPGDQYILVWTDDDDEYSNVTEFAQFIFEERQ